jgi:hypothetical protein
MGIPAAQRNKRRDAQGAAAASRGSIQRATRKAGSRVCTAARTYDAQLSHNGYRYVQQT